MAEDAIRVQGVSKWFDSHTSPRERFLRFFRLELWHSAIALPLQPLRLPAALWRGAVALGRAVASLGKWKKKEEEGEPAVAVADKAPEPPSPLVVASLGPGFLLAGLVTAVLYLLARLAEPLLHAELGLSPGLSAWQYLFLGRRPELAREVALDRRLQLAEAVEPELGGQAHHGGGARPRRLGELGDRAERHRLG